MYLEVPGLALPVRPRGGSGSVTAAAPGPCAVQPRGRRPVVDRRAEVPAADGYQLTLRLAHADERVLSRGRLVLSYGVVARHVAGVDAGPVGRLEAAGAARALGERPRARRVRYQFPQVVRRPVTCSYRLAAAATRSCKNHETLIY